MIAGKFVEAPGANVKLPMRQTQGSAGYDFYAPEKIILEPKSARMFNTGVIANIEPGYVLLLFPRSGLGMKGIRIANTIGVIDSDYEFEICCKLVNDSNELVVIEKGDRYMQGVFVQFGITENDDAVSVERTGGMGSTGA